MTGRQIVARRLPVLRVPGAVMPQTCGCGSHGDVAAPAFFDFTDVAATDAQLSVRALTGGARVPQDVPPAFLLATGGGGLSSPFFKVTA